MTPYLWLLLALVALAYYPRTVAALSVVAIAASVTPHMKVAKP